MIKDGYINVGMALIDNIVQAETIPCPACGSCDCLVIEDATSQPTGLKLACANPECGYSVDDELFRYADFHDDALKEAIQVWNIGAYVNATVVEKDGKVFNAQTGELK